MQDPRNSHQEKQRATFVEVISSIRFDHKHATDAAKTDNRHRPGFATNRSLHSGVAAPDDYKLLEQS